MGLFMDAFEFVFAGGCLLGVSLLFMLLLTAIQNLPGLLRTGRRAARELLILAYRLYKPVIGQLEPVANRHLGIELGKMPFRTLTCCLLSLLILFGIDLLLGWRVSTFFSVLAILHGALVGLLWDEFDRSDGIQMGEKIQ